MPEPLVGSKPWTIVVKHGPVEFSDKTYQRVFRGSNDIPNWYYSLNSSSWGCKTASSGKVATTTECIRNNLSQYGNTFITVCDGTNIFSYANGILYAIEQASNLTSTSASQVFGCGDNDKKDWHFNLIEIQKFDLYDRALSVTEVEAICGMNTYPIPEITE